MEKKAEGEKAVEMFQLVKKNNLLPAKTDELVRLSFIGGAAVSFYRTKIAAMTNLNVAAEQRKATLKDGQDAAEMLLDIEARIGELLPPVEVTRRTGRGVSERNTRGQATKGCAVKTLPDGINKKKAFQSRRIAENPEIVEKVKTQARENDDIPTTTAVLKAISYKKAQEKKADESSHIAALGSAGYLNILDRCIRLLPENAPADLSAQAFREAHEKVKIIVNRLNVFLNKNAPEKTDENLQQA